MLNKNISKNNKNMLTNGVFWDRMKLRKGKAGARGNTLRPQCNHKRGNHMWNSDKSTLLSLICTRIVMAGGLVLMITGPRFLKYYLEITERPAELLTSLLIICYACAVFVMGALAVLDRLLSNIRKGNVLVSQNVTCLRIISWCCFGVALVLVAGGYQYLSFLVIGLLAGFAGLVLRAMKNVFQHAVEVKQENDFTI